MGTASRRYKIQNFVFRGEVVYLTDIRRHLLTREQIFQSTARFENDDAVRFNATDTLDRLDRPFEIARGIMVPIGDYHFNNQSHQTGAGSLAEPDRALMVKLTYSVHF